MENDNTGVVTVTESDVQVVGDEVIGKLETMQDVVMAIQNDPENSLLADNVRRFKLMMVKKSLIDIMNMIELKDLVQTELMKKVKEDISIYPLTTQIDILNDMNSLIDRDLKIMESIIPRTESLAEFLERTSKKVTIVQQINVDTFSPTQMEKVSQIVEAVISNINQVTSESK